MKQWHLPILALILANTIWGAASPIYKWSLENIEPFTLGFFRFAIATIILYLLTRNHLQIKSEHRVKLFLICLTLFLHIALLNIALELTDSINAPIIGSSVPIFLIASSFFILKEKVKIRKILGGIVGFLGVLLIVFMPILMNGYDGKLLGNTLLVVSMVFSVIYTVILKEIISDYKPLTLVFWSFVGAAAFFLPLMLFETNMLSSLKTLTLQGISGVIYASLFSSITAYICFYYAVKFLEVSDVGVFSYLDPVAAVLVAMPLLGEIPTQEYIIGSFLVFLGIYIAENRLHYHPFHKLRK